ncbi:MULTISPECIES: hypothetical protein [Thermus]|uniref:Uncharacterized protein n=2 Tax=Thermus TaxID=270 RepID=H9ZV35_THETH|nr:MULTISPECIES: hypothetical protein [Thermus]AFH40195.1 hypothetical protein TtJL18_2367 [Thermus thermophilus JL-18]AFV77480.1 hypothetical protein Theos_2505 [Thermus oshimai JL-2]
MAIFIQRKHGGEEILQVIPREAVVMVELRGGKVMVHTRRSAVEVRPHPDHLAEVKANLLGFASGKLLWIREEG